MINRQMGVALRPPPPPATVDPSQWSMPIEAAVYSPTGRILELGQVLRRRAKLIVLTLVVLNCVGFIALKLMTPRYTSSADVIVASREEQVVDLKAVLSGLAGTNDVIESETQVLRSRQIARTVVTTLNLDQLPEFNPALRSPGLMTVATAWVGKGWSAIAKDAGFSTKTAQEGPAGSTAPVQTIDPLSAPVDRFLNQLDVAQKGRSRVLTISFTSTDPALAARVPNVVADAYIANQLRAKTEANAQATKWLVERVAEMRQQMLNADEAVEAYRRRADIVPLNNDSTLLKQQLSEGGLELMRAKEQVAIAEGKVSAAARYNPNALGLTRAADEARARLLVIEQNNTELQHKADAGNQSQIMLQALQREADADRALYEKLLARARETKIQSGLQQADASIISRAERPEDPSFPKPAIMLPLFFIIAAVLAVLLAIWLESLDHGFSRLDQMAAVLGIPAIGSVPLIKAAFRRRRADHTYRVDQVPAEFIESVRSLYTSLLLSEDSETTKTVLITSTLGGEGKTSMTVAMAGVLASYGKRVVVVDCDLRNPTMHTSFGVPRAPGLLECLKGEVQLDAALAQHAASAVYLLPAGGNAMAPPGLLGSKQMRELLNDLSASFDLVLLDGAPVLGGADTLPLSRIADKTVFVVRWQGARCAAVIGGLRQLLDAGANVVGALLTMMDPKQHQKHSTGDMYRRHLIANPGT